MDTGGELAHQAYQGHAHEGSALAEDVHEAEVFAAALRGDDLCQIAPAQSLNAALEHTHSHSQDPELPLGHQEHGKEGDAGVGDDADLDEKPGVVLCRQPPEDNGAGEGHKLGQQQGKQQSRVVQAQGGAVGRGHVDNGVNAVNEEEEGNEIQENVLFLPGVPDGPAQLTEGILQRAAASFHKGGLAVLFQKGQGAQNPPKGGNEESAHHGGGLAQAEGVVHEHQNQAENEGNHGADVAEGVAHGGDLVHAVSGGDLREHGVVEHQAGGVVHLCHNKNHKKAQPARRQTQSGAADAAHGRRQQEDLLLEFPVRQGAADGGDKGNQNGGNGACIAPIAEVKVLVKAAGACQGIEVNGKHGRYQKRKGRVSDVVEDPALFQRGQFEFLHMVPFLLLFLIIQEKVTSKSSPNSFSSLIWPISS